MPYKKIIIKSPYKKKKIIKISYKKVRIKSIIKNRNIKNLLIPEIRQPVGAGAALAVGLKQAAYYGQRVLRSFAAL